MSRRRLIAALAIGSSSLGGCATRDDAAQTRAMPAAPRRVARYVPPPDRYVKSSLLTFESGGDATFIDAPDVRLAADPSQPSNKVLVADRAAIKLGSLVRGRDFPGPWDLVGFRVRCDRVGTVATSLENASPTTQAVPPVPANTQLLAGEWKDVWVNLLPGGSPTTRPAMSAASPRGAAPDSLRLIVRSASGQPVMIDDVVIAQSYTVVSESILPVTGERWLVRRMGFEWQVIVGDQVVLALPAAPFRVDGYRVLEANPVRVVFVSPTGATLSIDRTGRLIDGSYARVDAKVMAFAKTTAENASPAQVEVLEDQGRLDRNRPGDRDNDGYDETRGCYTVRAAGPRLTLRMQRRQIPVKWPIVEILDLPAGAVNVWLEGQTVPWVTRLADGRTILELPIELERPVEVRVHVK